MCPITVGKALTNFEGVYKAQVSLAENQAVVTFEDQKPNPKALIKANTDAGYPASIKR